MKCFSDVLHKVTENKTKKIAVAVAQDMKVLKAIDLAYKKGITQAILIGDGEEIYKIASEINMDLSNYEIIDEVNKTEATRTAVELVRDGKADMLMKGFVDTSVIMKAALDKEVGLKTDNLISHVGVLKVESFDKLFIISDSAMNISPDVKQKARIIENAVKVANALEIANPKVAIVCPVEKVNAKISSTLDAEKLVEMNINGDLENCVVGGPFALDNAISEEAAHHKGIEHEVAGRADILIPPDLNSANILNKSMEYFAKAEKAGVVMGAAAPIVLTSRASSEESKMNSIALAALISESF